MRAVDEYAIHPWGLYLARATPGRAQFHYLESWLLPLLGLRATVFHFNSGYERNFDYYLDIGEYTPGETVWHSEDHYLDVEVYAGNRTELVDVDELMDAVHQGLLTPAVAELAVRRAITALEGLAHHNYDLNVWLATDGIELSWPKAAT